MKIPRLYPSGKRRSANGLRDEAKTSKWPDFAPLITFIGVACFTASLTYVAGLSAGLNQNLMGFFDLSDFLRITPTWAIPALGVTVFLDLRSFLANAHRAEEKNLSVSEPKTKWEKFFRLIRHFAPEATGLLIGLTVVVTYILSFFVRHKWFLLTLPQFLLWIFLTTQLVSGFVKRFRQARPNDSFIYGLIPVNLALQLALALVTAFLFGLWMVPHLYIEKAPVARIALKDEKIVVEGKVFLELNRFILFVAPGNKVTAVAVSDVSWIELSKAGPKHNKRSPK